MESGPEPSAVRMSRFSSNFRVDWGPVEGLLHVLIKLRLGAKNSQNHSELATAMIVKIHFWIYDLSLYGIRHPRKTFDFRCVEWFFTCVALMISVSFLAILFLSLEPLSIEDCIDSKADRVGLMSMIGLLGRSWKTQIRSCMID